MRIKSYQQLLPVKGRQGFDLHYVFELSALLELLALPRGIVGQPKKTLKNKNKSVQHVRYCYHERLPPSQALPEVSVHKAAAASNNTFLLSSGCANGSVRLSRPYSAQWSRG